MIRRWIEREWPRIKRRAARIGAHIIFMDETGFLLQPLVRRTWGLVGRTPVLRQRTRRHEHVSAIGALSISPKRRRLGWYLQFHPGQSIHQELLIPFLRHLLRHLRGPVIVIWDRLSAHKGRLLQAWVRRHRRLELEYLPPYAPELNPNEYGWAYLKKNPLANYCPATVPELHDRAQEAAAHVAGQQRLLRSFVHQSPLPIRIGG